MKGKLVYNRSGYLVVWPVIAGLFICCILSFIFRSYALSFVLLLVFLVMLTARLWSAQCIKKLQFSVRASGMGVFPGEQIVFHIEVKNDKFLPVMCAEAYFPLAKNLCLLPEHVRDTQDSEKAYLEDFYVSVEKIGEQPGDTPAGFLLRIREAMEADRYQTAAGQIEELTVQLNRNFYSAHPEEVVYPWAGKLIADVRRMARKQKKTEQQRLKGAD